MSDAIVLAAGVGSRLSSVHGDRPKCLVPVAGKPILEHQLEALAALSIQNLVIVTGYRAEMVRQASTSLDLPFEITFVNNPDFRTTNVLSSWLLGSDALSGDDFFYLHGDTVFEPELLDRLASDVSLEEVTLTVDPHATADEEMKVVTDGHAVLEISKRLDPSIVTGEFTGVLHAPRRSFSSLQELSRSILSTPEGSHAFFEAALQRGIEASSLSVRWIDVSGLRWCEVDFPEDLERAEKLFGT